jgi:hypothetical protein
MHAAPPISAPLALGAVTIVALGGRMYGKPAGGAEATGMLRALRGRAPCCHRRRLPVRAAIPYDAPADRVPGSA